MEDRLDSLENDVRQLRLDVSQLQRKIELSHRLQWEKEVAESAEVRRNILKKADLILLKEDLRQFGFRMKRFMVGLGFLMGAANIVMILPLYRLLGEAPDAPPMQDSHSEPHAHAPTDLK